MMEHTEDTIHEETETTDQPLVIDNEHASSQQKQVYKPFDSWSELFDTLRPKWEIVHSKESLIRDLLAAERTNLAWLRTGLAVTALGIALVRFLDANQILVKGAGAFFVISGLLVFMYSWLRFQLVAKRIQQGVFTVDTVASSLMLLFGIVASVLAFLLVFL